MSNNELSQLIDYFSIPDILPQHYLNVDQQTAKQQHDGSMGLLKRLEMTTIGFTDILNHMKTQIQNKILPHMIQNANTILPIWQ